MKLYQPGRYSEDDLAIAKENFLEKKLDIINVDAKYQLIKKKDKRNHVELNIVEERGLVSFRLHDDLVTFSLRVSGIHSWFITSPIQKVEQITKDSYMIETLNSIYLLRRT